MTPADDLVSVIIPAHNAARTLGATLDSVLAQTHRNLEVIVIDDGSTDDTGDVMATVAARDPRVIPLHQTKAGVAAARNAGIAHARGDFVAPVDADDLWHPEKIARQLAVMTAGGPRLGLVYAWSSHIDEADRITCAVACVSHHAGDVYAALVVGNFVGNASAPLMRRQAVIEAGGYDPGLRARGAQGCEDHKLYLAIAERYAFGVVPRFLVGYRQSADSMSGDIRQMKRSHDRVMGEVRERHPELPARLFRWADSHLCYWLATRCIDGRAYGTALRMIARSALYDPANLLHPWFLRTIAKVGKVAALDLAGRPRFRVPTRIFPDPAPDPAVTMPGFGPRAWIDRRRLDTIRAAQGMLLKDALADIPKSAYQGGMHSD